jgi:hypothetical protein
MKSDKTTIVLKKGVKQFKLFKIIFQTDGTYFITAPYHNCNSACLFKVIVDYRKSTQTISWSETLDKMELDDEEHALKISHHPSGFLQFSGKNIRSGINTEGTPKGMGIQSWTHEKPAPGPSWGISIKNINFLKETTNVTHECLLVDTNAIVDGIEFDDVIISGFFIPVMFAPYIFLENGIEFFSLTHPTGVNLKLYIVRAQSVDKCKGFFGIHFQFAKLNFAGNESGFIFSTSSGDTERDEHGLIKGTCMFALYPSAFKN